MLMNRLDPFRDLTVLQDRINRMFSEHASREGESPAAARTWAPVVDILETDTDLTVLAELPGLQMSDIEVEVTSESLVIRGERKMDEARQDKYLRVERPHGPFQRSFTIGVPVQPDKVKATYREGILEVIIPKAEEVKPKKIEIKAE